MNFGLGAFSHSRNFLRGRGGGGGGGGGGGRGLSNVDLQILNLQHNLTDLFVPIDFVLVFDFGGHPSPKTEKSMGANKSFKLHEIIWGIHISGSSC